MRTDIYTGHIFWNNNIDSLICVPEGFQAVRILPKQNLKVLGIPLQELKTAFNVRVLETLLRPEQTVIGGLAEGENPSTRQFVKA